MHFYSHSFLPLIKSLSPEKWPDLCSIVLDITGENRLQPPDDRSCDQLLCDIVAEMRMAGRIEDAVSVQRTTQSLLGDTDGVEATLLAVLLSAQNLRKERSNWKNQMFALELEDDKVEVNTHWPKVPCNVFSDPLNESVQTMQQIPNETTNMNQPTDIIADVARFEHQNIHSYMQKRLAVSQVILGYGATGNHAGDGKLATRVAAYAVDEKPDLVEKDAKPTEDDAISLVLQNCVSGSRELQVLQYSKPAIAEYLKLHSVLLLQSDCDEERTKCLQSALFKRLVSSGAYREGLCKLAANPIQPDPDEDLSERSQVCGAIYQSVHWFIQCCRLIEGKRVLQAVKSYAETVLNDYHCNVVKAAEHTPEDERDAWNVLSTAERDVFDLRQICDVIDEIEQTDGSACSIIDIVCQKRVLRPHCECTKALLHAVMQPYLEWIWDWLFEGSSDRDPDNDFFGKQLGILSSTSEDFDAGNAGSAASIPTFMTREDALFLLRAGRSHGVLTQLGVELPLDRASRFEMQPDEEHSGDVFERFSEAVEAVTARLCCDGDDREARGRQSERTPIPASPSVYCASPHPRSAGIDFVLSDVSESNNEDDSEGEPSLERGGGRRKPLEIIAEMPEVFAFPEDKRSARNRYLEMFTNALTDSQSTLSSSSSNLPNGNGKAAGGPTGYILPSHAFQRVIRQLAKFDSIVQQHLLDEARGLGIFEHLMTLRQYVLLGAGDFSNMLVEKLEVASRKSDRDERYLQKRALAARTFYGSGDAGSRQSRNMTHVERCLRVALNLCTANDEYVDCLSVCVTSEEDEKRLWECRFFIEYNCGFPHDIVLNGEIIELYSRIFDLFIHIIRARRSLGTLFVICRRSRAPRWAGRKYCESEANMSGLMYEFCLEGEAFTCGFGGYEMQQVLDVGWKEFETGMESVKSLWELKNLHEEFMSKAVKRCLLESGHEKVLNVMKGGLDIVTNVRIEMEKVVNVGRDDCMAELLKSGMMSLRRRAAFLTEVVGIKVRGSVDK